MKELFLKDICNLDNGHAFKSNDYITKSNTLICRMSNIRPDGSFDIFYHAKYLPDEYAEKYKKYLLKDGDLIVAMTDMSDNPTFLGVPTIVNTLGFNLLLNQRVGRLRFIKEDIDDNYLRFALQSKKARSYLTQFATGGVQINVSKKDILNTPIRIRCYEDQKYIADLLMRVTLIKKQLEKELCLLDKLISSRFIEMFGHQSNNEKRMSYMELSDVAEIYLGLTHTPKYYDNGVIFISAKNTSKDYLDLKDIKYISQEEFENAPNGAKPQKNDVLFSRVGSNLGHPVILEKDMKLCTFVSLGFLRSKGKVTSNYLKHWMRDEFFLTQVKKHVKGGGQLNLNTGWLKQFKIIVPDIDEQLQFDKFCNQVDKSKFAVQKSLDETQLLFDSLMQEYFG